MDYAVILEKLATTGASEQEMSLLRAWLDSLSIEAYQQVLEKFESLLTDREVTEPFKEEWLKELLHVIHEKSDDNVKPAVFKRYRRQWMVAASVVLLAGIAGYAYFIRKPVMPEREVIAASRSDITAPGSNRATITLTDGTTVYLDSAGNGQIAMLGNVQLLKLGNGQISYQATGNKVANGLQYNTLTNPRGSKVVDIRLSDGSHIWLNAGSSISYPVAFTGKVRKVQLTGEGYFEVARNPLQKFIVDCDGIQTEVLGTRFNINSYKNESEPKVTLLEGSIKVIADMGSLSKILKPGQQAVGSDLRTINVQEDKVMSWKNGYFNLEGLAFTEIMHQLERWYDVEVVFPSGVPNIELFGKIGRDLSLSEVVNSLKDMGVSCTIEQNRLVVKK
ncbi:FecR family protein [Niabella aurantiaca]|uniref:FecR family protein n=1 Tax=Niabella aurantiaca TaxID=379900 RepID=UPI000380EEA5|nr:FecR family protein [Niabella aurantiaca]